jgi:hypothetical protein
LGLYKGLTLSAQQIQDEHAKNKELGISLGQWKGGMLVYDDEGRVLEALTSDATDLIKDTKIVETRKRSRRNAENK